MCLLKWSGIKGIQFQRNCGATSVGQRTLFIQIIYSFLSHFYIFPPIAQLHFLHINTHTTHNSSIRSDEGLTLERPSQKTPYGNKFTLSTQLINPNSLVGNETACGKISKNRAREKFRGYTRRTKTFAVLPSPPLPAFSLSTLDGVPLGMTREMDISTLIGRETKSVFLVGKGYLVNNA